MGLRVPNYVRMQWEGGLEAAWGLLKDYSIRSVRGTHGPLLATPEKRVQLKSALQVPGVCACGRRGRPCTTCI